MRSFITGQSSSISASATALSEPRADARNSGERERWRQIQASARLRETEIASGRADRRARVRVAASVFASTDHRAPPLVVPMTPILSTEPGTAGSTDHAGCGDGPACATPIDAEPSIPPDRCGLAGAPPGVDAVAPIVTVGCNVGLDCRASLTCDVATHACIR